MISENFHVSVLQFIIPYLNFLLFFSLNLLNTVYTLISLSSPQQKSAPLSVHLSAFHQKKFFSHNSTVAMIQTFLL